MDERHTVLHCPPLLVSEPAGKPVPAPSAGEKPAAQREASAGQFVIWAELALDSGEEALRHTGLFWLCVLGYLLNLLGPQGSDL